MGKNIFFGAFGLFISAVIILSGCKSTERGHTGSPKSVNYNQYETFSFGKPLVLSSKNPVFSWSQFSERIRRDLSFLLPSVGLDPSRNGEGDLTIYYYAIIQQVDRTPMLPYHIGWAAEPFISRGENYDRYPPHTFVLDLVDAHSNELVWRGSISLPFDNPDQLYTVLPKRLGSLIRNYPSVPTETD